MAINSATITRTKLSLKYTFCCEPRDLFMALTKPAYLQNWIAENVEFNSRTGVYTFHWTSFSESARITEREDNKFIKWEWTEGDHPEGEYVSFRIDEPAGDEWLDLYIEDFCDPQEEEDVRAGWDQQMERLESIMG